jgi:hypothetical protein
LVERYRLYVARAGTIYSAQVRHASYHCRRLTLRRLRPANNVDVLALDDADRPAVAAALTPTRTWTPRRALVPLDGSTVAEAIIPFVSRIAPPLGLEIALLRVVPEYSDTTPSAAAG